MLTKTLEPPVHYNPDLTQIINGEEVMSPSPKPSHQDVVLSLGSTLRSYVKLNNLGKVYIAPLDVILQEGFNILQPDVLFISKSNIDTIQDWVRGAPDIVVEIISPSSIKMDTVIKKEIYERYGVPECWLVFPKTQTIEIYSLKENKYELYRTFGHSEAVSSPVLPGLNFPAESIFE
jgi:Uma2 family endonuclease